MLLVCLNEEIKDRERDRENAEFRDLHAAERSGVDVVRLPSSLTVMKAPSLSEQHGVSS